MKKIRLIVAIFCSLTLIVWFDHWQEYREYWREDELIHQSRVEMPDTEPFDDETVATWSDHKTCKEKRMNIAFLKTHKTGSSTITSVLNRFADVNDLDIALPLPNTRFNWPFPFKHSYVDRTRLKYKKANILCNHAVLDRKELYKIMRKEFKLITILRNPVEQVHSLFNYENFTQIYKLQNESDPVQAFFQNTSRYYRSFKSRLYPELFFKENLLKNGMIFDLNFQRFQKRLTHNSFKDFIEYIDKAFHLVLITELFDEGLVLLKKRMCWGYMDIVYQKKLVKRKRKKTVSEDLKKKIKNWNYRDVKLYEHFKNKLQRIIDQQDAERFEEEVFKFQTLNQLVSNFCEYFNTSSILEVTSYMEEIREDPPPEFVNRPECFCKKLDRSELQYLRYFDKNIPSFYFVANLRRGKRAGGC